jgi:hypothetical protein
MDTIRANKVMLLCLLWLVAYFSIICTWLWVYVVVKTEKEETLLKEISITLKEIQWEPVEVEVNY